MQNENNGKTDLVKKEFEEMGGCYDGGTVYNNYCPVTVNMAPVNVSVVITEGKTYTKTEDNSSASNGTSMGELGSLIGGLLNLIDK